MTLTITTLVRRHLPVLRLKGELDVAQGAKLQSEVSRLLAEGSQNIVLSMVDLDYLDSSGLGSLVAVAKEVKAADGRLMLITNDFVDEILAITRLNEIFEQAKDEQEALERLSA